MVVIDVDVASWDEALNLIARLIVGVRTYCQIIGMLLYLFSQTKYDVLPTANRQPGNDGNKTLTVCNFISAFKTFIVMLIILQIEDALLHGISFSSFVMLKNGDVSRTVLRYH